MIIIVFRGRNTDGIIKDVSLHYPKSDCYVLCRKDDKMAQEGDIISLSAFKDELVLVVANGGTTEQLFNALITLQNAAFIELQKGGFPKELCKKKGYYIID